MRCKLSLLISSAIFCWLWKHGLHLCFPSGVWLLRLAYQWENSSFGFLALHWMHTHSPFADRDRWQARHFLLVGSEFFLSRGENDASGFSSKHLLHFFGSWISLLECVLHALQNPRFPLGHKACFHCSSEKAALLFFCKHRRQGRFSMQSA